MWVLPVVGMLVIGIGLTGAMTGSDRIGDLPPGSCFDRTWLSSGEVPAQVKPVSCTSSDAKYRFLGSTIGDHDDSDTACRISFGFEAVNGTIRGRSFPKDEFGTLCVELLR